MNLAPWKYRDILTADHGPILRIELTKLDSLFLQTVYEGFAELNPELKPEYMRVENPARVYGTADGNGTSIYRNQARYKAVSEALERWAFYEMAVNQNTNDFGFAFDRSSTGMAAFPALTAGPARRNAFYEAVERWSLCAWWEGKLRATPLPKQANIEGVEIQSAPLFSKKSLPALGSPTVTVVLWHKAEQGYCYGFACAASREQAIKRALVELDRNYRVLFLPTLSDTIGEVTDIGEKRLLFFSTIAGHTQFTERVQRSLNALPASSFSGPPALVVDSAIVGPWSRYCHVWRCLFEPVSKQYDSELTDYFFF